MQSVHAQHAYNLSVVRLPDGPTHAPHASLLSSLGDAMTAAAALRATPASSAKPHLKLSPAAPTPRTPLLVDLRPRMPAVYDQGTLGSCTANALCGATQYMWPAAGPGSRLFVYYNERLLENDIPDDAGAYLCDGVIALEKYGVCSEARWPYDVAEFATAPPATCYADAAGHLLPTAHAVPPTLAAMKQCIALGYPFVVGIQIYGSFETAQVATTGVVPMPAAGDALLGGHAVLCVGYNDLKKQWTMRNSWGAGWGAKGYFYLPYDYLVDPALSSDAWTLH